MDTMTKLVLRQEYMGCLAGAIATSTPLLPSSRDDYIGR